MISNIKSSDSVRGVCLVIGAGDATGGAIARRFARDGYASCVTRRSADKLQPLKDAIEAEGGICHAFGSDARKEEEVVALVEQIESTIGPIEVLVFNIGANAPSSVLDETARKYFKIWEMACFSGFLNGREVAKADGDACNAKHASKALFSLARPLHCVGRGFCGFFRRKNGVTRLGAEHGARTWSARHPCRAQHH